MSGYTDEVKGSDGNMVFLKNVGDKVTLWFRLNQDINKLNAVSDNRDRAFAVGMDDYLVKPVKTTRLLSCLAKLL